MKVADNQASAQNHGYEGRRHRIIRNDTKRARLQFLVIVAYLASKTSFTFRGPAAHLGCKILERPIKNFRFS